MGESRKEYYREYYQRKKAEKEMKRSTPSTQPRQAKENSTPACISQQTLHTSNIIRFPQIPHSPQCVKKRISHPVGKSIPQDVELHTLHTLRNLERALEGIWNPRVEKTPLGTIPLIAAAAGLITLVGVLTWFLVIESAALYVGSQRYPILFASLVECGVIALSLYSPKKILSFLGVKALLVGLIVYSLAVLASGVEMRGDLRVAESSANGEKIALLKSDIEAKEGELQRLLAQNYLGASRKLSVQIDALKEDLRRELSASSALVKPSTLQRQTLVLVIGRGLLLLINVVFSHLLAVVFSKLWSQRSRDLSEEDALWSRGLAS